MIEKIKYNHCADLMKIFLRGIISVVLVTMSFSFSLLAQTETHFVTSIISGSTLQINGTSNIRDFQCVYEGVFNPDTLKHTVTFKERKLEVTGDTLHLKIDSFECGKKGLNRDFRNTLNYSEFPSIDISPIGFSKNDSLLSKMNVSISLAGVAKEYLLDFNSESSSNELFRITGSQRLKMSDFNIDPPKALFGLIKVDDELVIVFDMIFKLL